MDTTILQVPVSKELRNKAASAAEAMGFSSLQETIRLFLKKLATGSLEISFGEPTVMLSARNARRYDKMIADYETGKLRTKTFTDVDGLMKDLMG